MPECAGIRIAVSPAGVPWVINKSNLIYRYNGNTWDLLPGTGTDIGIGADGSVFIIGTVDVSPTGGFNIMKWNGTGWDTLPNCSGTRIAVMPNGIPWVVNKSNIVYRNTGTELWAAVSGVKGNDIGIGAEGSVFVTGKDSTTASYHPHIYKYLSNGNWATINDASGVSIAVSPKGRPWWIDKSNNIFKLND
jgi:ribosomal protein L27